MSGSPKHKIEVDFGASFLLLGVVICAATNNDGWAIVFLILSIIAADASRHD